MQFKYCTQRDCAKLMSGIYAERNFAEINHRVPHRRRFRPTMRDLFPIKHRPLPLPRTVRVAKYGYLIEEFRSPIARKTLTALNRERPRV